MKLLFNLEVIERNRNRARPSEYLQSLPADQQHAAVTEFLEWAKIVIATPQEFLGKLQPRIYTGSERAQQDE